MPAKVEYIRKIGLSNGKLGNGKELDNLELNELFRARDASCPKEKKMGRRYRKIVVC